MACSTTQCFGKERIGDLRKVILEQQSNKPTEIGPVSEISQYQV